MAVERVFLGWNTACLPMAAQYLLDRFTNGEHTELGDVIVALPGGRSGRRLLELLVEMTDDRDLSFSPPRIVTTGRLIDELIEFDQPVASDLVRILAWSQAMQNMPAEELAALVPIPPDESDWPAWWALAERFDSLHRELAGEMIAFAAVADELESQLTDSNEPARWRALESVQSAFNHVLDEFGWADQQTLRLSAIQASHVDTTPQIVLIAAVDLNKQTRAVIDLLADKVTSLIHAPQSIADRFDDYGCIRPQAWLDAKIDLTDDQIRVVQRPNDQAKAVMDVVASFDGQYATDEVSIGVADEELTPFIEQTLAEYGLRTRFAVGFEVRRSGPYRLLEVLAEFLETGSFHSLAALLRHPDVIEIMTPSDESKCTEPLHALDKFADKHLPTMLWSDDLNQNGSLPDVVRDFLEWCSPLMTDAQLLSVWPELILKFMARVYGKSFNKEVASDHIRIEACQSITRVLSELAELEDELTIEGTADQVIRLVLSRIAGDAIPMRIRESAVEMIGWLELHLDDAPALIIAGFNEGRVPESVNADAFLPDSLRRDLDLLDNARRFARDAYLLSAISPSRSSLTLIAGRRTANSDPLSPSRLLFACDEDLVVQRVLKYFDPANVDQPVRLPFHIKHADVSRFIIPRPDAKARQLTSLGVTAFRDYLACPYRFYLRHVLGLDSQDDRAEELSPASFGELAHAVLQSFGEGEYRNSMDPDKIRLVLSADLDRVVAERFGSSPRAVIRVQIEQLRARLNRFADWQAEWCANGWRIERCETVFNKDNQVAIDVDGQAFYLRGRIDRIDVNDVGERVILDYKFSETASKPEKAHQSGTDWVDLQLPLYRHLVAAIGIDPTDVKLGYISLPKKLDDMKESIAKWSDGDLEKADEVTHHVIRCIRNQTYWPPQAIPPAFSEIFASICQDNQLSAAQVEDDD